MADIKLSQLLTSNPVTAPMDGEEPIETVKSSTSEAARLRQLSATPTVPVAGTAHILALTDQGKVVTMSSASANTVTVPNNSSVAFPVNATLLVRQIGTGQTSIAAAGGVTIEKKASASLNLSEQQAQVVLHKVATNTWHLAGELTPL